MAGPRRALYAGRVIRIVLLVALVPGLALAQVSVNSGALDQLKPSAPAAVVAKPARPRASEPPAVRHPAAPARPSRPVTPPPASPAKPKPRSRPVSVAPAPPPAAVLPPPVEAPRPAPSAPPPVPVLPDAAGEFTPIPGGVRITFGPATADLNPNTANAIREIAREVKADPAVDLNVYAYAAGVPDDPSTPRRLSLSRALAVRALLISEGIVSTRIYPRALGATVADGPPDHVDLVRAGTPMPAAKP